MITSLPATQVWDFANHLFASESQNPGVQFTLDPLNHAMSTAWPQCNLLAGEVSISLLPGGAGLSMQAGADS